MSSMMRWIHHLPVATKLRVIVVYAAASALVTASVLDLAGEAFALRRDLTEHLMTLATMAGENVAAALTAADRPLARHILGALRADPNIRSVTLYDAAGKLFLDLPLAPDQLAPEARLQAWSIDVAVRDPQVIRHRGLTGVHLLVPLLLDGNQIGALHVDAELSQLRSRLQAALAIMAIALLLAGVAVYLLSLRLQRIISAPVGELLRVTRDVREGKNFAVRGVKHADDEFGELTDGLNAILTELEKRDLNLRVYQNELEARVRERTVSLDAAVAEARDAVERIEGASRAKSEFLARMSHEIRTPMNAVLGMTELLRHATKLDDRQRRYADTIHQSGSALLGIINDILDFSKIEAGKLELDIAPFSVREMVEDAVEMLAERAHRKGLELLCDIPPDVETAVCGDGQRLRQIIINLVGNAVKFTERGEIRIVARDTSIDRIRSTFRFEVIDTGVGIKPENCATIFESFVQEDNSTTRKYGGTGLGLAICKQLVELMGGEIGVTSTPGVGSTFFFSVVLANDPATVRGVRPANLKKTRVLVVDDNTGNREIVAGHLKSWGVRVTEAGSARMALEILEAKGRAEFDALILDGQMPRMDGFTLANEIRSLPGFADMPIAMMSSISEAPASDDAGTGRKAWLTKPVRRSQLHACLASLLPPPASSATAGVRDAGRTNRSTIVQALRERCRIRRVLLVEDNPVNQELAQSMLLELGVETASAWTGEEALVKLAADRFEVILMDCQMPKLDGYATTRRFREWERRTGRDRTPIVALTANALNGDAARCFEAGMDRYLSKPFTIEQLHRILDSCAAEDVPAESASLPEAAALDECVLDRIRHLHKQGGANLLAKLAGLYLPSSRRHIDVIRAALGSNDADGVAKGAHALKSSSGSIGATVLAGLCSALEAAGRGDSLEGAHVLLEKIVVEHARVLHALESLEAAA